jgi:hypothetical protein
MSLSPRERERTIEMRGLPEKITLSVTHRA